MEERTHSATKWLKENPQTTTPSVVEGYPHFLPVFAGLSSKDGGWRGIEAVKHHELSRLSSFRIAVVRGGADRGLWWAPVHHNPLWRRKSI
jgi:hypothetical protein